MEVPDAEAEHYAFLRLYSIDLDVARQSCELFTGIEDAQIRHAVLRDLVVTYARPFSGNRREHGGPHHISSRAVPKEMRALHQELMTLRMQAFAHTDQAFRRPQIARWPRSSGGAYYGLGFANPAYDSLTTRIADIETLVVAVESRVNEMVRECEARFERLYAPPAEKSSAALGA